MTARATDTRALAVDALLLAAALLLSYLEFLLLPAILLPGIKLGLANVCIMFCFFRVGARHAAAVSLMRVFITALLFGNLPSFIFSLLGAVCAYAALVLLSIPGRHISRLGQSVGCAAAHATGQLTAAALVYGTAGVFAYLPVMLLVSVPLGTLTGMLLILCESKIPSTLPTIRNKGNV
ncbi:MAG: Gx transporter family protein [Eubacteriales bacterium]